MAVIKIPSKHIYEMQNEKVIDNDIDKIEVQAKTVVPNNEYDVSVFTGDFSSTSYNSGTPSSNIKEELRLHTHGATTYAAAYGVIKPYYVSVHIEVQKKYISHKVASIKGGADENGNANIKYSTVCTKKTAPITATYNRTDSGEGSPSFTNISYSYTGSGETKVWDLPKKLTISKTYQDASTSVDVNLNDETNLKEIGNTIAIGEDSDKFYFDCYVLCGVETYEITGGAYGPPTNTSSASGTATLYSPVQVSITVYGNTIGIDLQDNTITIGDGKNVISFQGNELMQTTNVPTLKKQYQDVLGYWKNGKETAVLRCGIADYYDVSGVGKIISISKQDGKPMAFRIGDIVQPYVYGANGQDRPMSVDKDGIAKNFEVISKRIIYDGAVWQEIGLQEYIRTPAPPEPDDNEAVITLNGEIFSDDTTEMCGIAFSLINGELQDEAMITYNGEEAQIRPDVGGGSYVYAIMNGEFYKAIGQTITVTKL